MKKLWIIPVLVLVFAFASCGSSEDKNDMGMMLPLLLGGGGKTLKFSNQQIYIFKNKMTGTSDINMYTKTVAAFPVYSDSGYNMGTASIKNGKLNAEISAPTVSAGTLDMDANDIKSYLSGWLVNNPDCDSTTAMFAVITGLKWSDDSNTYDAWRTTQDVIDFDDWFAWRNCTEVFYFYASENVTITGMADSWTNGDVYGDGSNVAVDFTVIAPTLNLKKGWNAVGKKYTTNGTDAVTIQFSTGNAGRWLAYY